MSILALLATYKGVLIPAFTALIAALFPSAFQKAANDTAAIDAAEKAADGPSRDVSGLDEL